ncbi:hypothetical protein DPMN_132492 [Dreissena polymorpha]|uniref:Uncharacterized protein n=1 Tax=Dreissena polymorpha TaxID=45954 RepID=A0A9D4FWV3_DREPO|nr:hypothetical protein DPMN_132492 [Dreissena polymorpha]
MRLDAGSPRLDEFGRKAAISSLMWVLRSRYIRQKPTLPVWLLSTTLTCFRKLCLNLCRLREKRMHLPWFEILKIGVITVERIQYNVVQA